MGPTAAGKTDLAVELTHRFPFEIISVDSAMVYCGMDIGTAKPSPQLLREVPHRLVDVCDPVDSYSAGRFYAEVKLEIEEILAKKCIPLLVGGTMLYFNVLQQGVAELPPADPDIRDSLSKEAAQKGWATLYSRLQSVDPKTASKLHCNDSQRIQRALEVHEITGKKMSDLHLLKDRPPLPYRVLNLILEPESRAYLHDRIKRRFDAMLQCGFLEEVRSLQERQDLHLGLPSMRTVGYRQAWSYLQGKYDKATMCEKAIAATRQLAKRQLTWLRHWVPACRYSVERGKSSLLEQMSRDLVSFSQFLRGEDFI